MAKLIIWQNGTSWEAEFTAPAILDHVLEQKDIRIGHPCGGRGTCGKCKVTLAGCVSEPNPMEQRAGVRLSCQAVLLGDAQVWLSVDRAMEQIEVSGSEKAGRIDRLHPMEGRLGAAIDIGTTTLALKLYDLKSGNCVGQSSMENPQRAVAADVMGRIQAAIEGGGELLQRQILKALKTLLDFACGDSRSLPGQSDESGWNLRGQPDESGWSLPGQMDESRKDIPEEVDAMAVVGNTTMLYLLTGKHPESLARAPFLADDLFDRMDTILGRETYLPPCMNAFVGADITAAVLTSGMCEKEEIALLCDIGTNGELALWKDRTLYVSSTAAGPAFEGAGISCGCGSIRGAVDKVWVEDGQIRVHTIGGAEPIGVCGSGLLDAIASYLELGEIDETGAMEEDELVLGGNVAILPKDVRAVQLAKGAIAAGIETMFTEAGIKADDVKKLYIAGGFGSHLNVESAVRIGLIPEELKGRVEILGNAALAGAVRMLLDQSSLETVRQIAKHSVHVNLGGNKVFNEWFVEKMMFE